jgi:hypothetical protein
MLILNFFHHSMQLTCIKEEEEEENYEFYYYYCYSSISATTTTYIPTTPTDIKTNITTNKPIHPFEYSCGGISRTKHALEGKRRGDLKKKIQKKINKIIFHKMFQPTYVYRST